MVIGASSLCFDNSRDFWLDFVRFEPTPGMPTPILADPTPRRLFIVLASNQAKYATRPPRKELCTGARRAGCTGVTTLPDTTVTPDTCPARAAWAWVTFVDIPSFASPRPRVGGVSEIRQASAVSTGLPATAWRFKTWSVSSWLIGRTSVSMTWEALRPHARRRR